MNTAIADGIEHPIDVASDKSEFHSWIAAMLMVAKHYGVSYSEENVRLASAWSEDSPLRDVLGKLALQMGMTIKLAPLDKTLITPWRLPLIVQFNDGQIAVAESISGDDNVALCHGGEAEQRSVLSRKELLQGVRLAVILRPARFAPDARVDDYIRPYQPHWFYDIVLHDLRPYGHVVLASLAANLLALSGVLFSRQVYDRVIPADSLPTLYVLFSGVALSMAFEFVLRAARIRITDLLGKRADVIASDTVFGRALRIKNDARPRSTGSFIAQIRELEQIRELLSSTTISALADLPFFLLFCLILWYVAGALVLVPMAAVLFLIIPGLVCQKPLRTLANEAMRESSLRNALLVEAVQGFEDIKILQAEPRFQQLWNRYNAVAADANLKLRRIGNTLSTWTHTLQGGVYALIIVFGAPMVMDGSLSVGSLIAASILASRMMAPMAQVTQVMSRWQQAKLALGGLDKLMERAVDHPKEERRVHKACIQGHFSLRQATFQYSESDSPALFVKGLEVPPGARIAVLGRNGSGKSTLLQGMAGLIEPQSGHVKVDGIKVADLDPADVRRDVGLLSQNAGLFYGSVRENLLLGAPNATDEELFAALELTGAKEFVQNLPKGLDQPIQEGGQRLSGGQRQALLLARLLVRQPRILLLDEPTASLDEASEKRFVDQLEAWLGHRTLVVATHRRSLLGLVDRILVVDSGKIVLDGPKSKVLSWLAAFPTSRP